MFPRKAEEVTAPDVVPRRARRAALWLPQVWRGDLHDRDVVQGERLRRRGRRVRLQGDDPK